MVETDEVAVVDCEVVPVDEIEVVALDVWEVVAELVSVEDTELPVHKCGNWLMW